MTDREYAYLRAALNEYRIRAKAWPASPVYGDRLAGALALILDDQDPEEGRVAGPALRALIKVDGIANSPIITAAEKVKRIRAVLDEFADNGGECQI